MIKYGKIMNIISQLCYNHALHLAVIDTFYKQKSIFVDKEEEMTNLDFIDDEIETDDEINDEYLLNMENDDVNVNVIS